MTSSRTIEYRVCHTPQHVFDPQNSILAEAVGSRAVMLVVDEALVPQYGRDLETYARAHLNCSGILCVPGSENAKSLDYVSSICAAAFDFGLPRNGVIVAVGGGTILDLAGFAASIFRRGIAYVRIPTTLIGMIDVGVGIKQAVNFRSKKNAIGSFFPPLVTINDASFLRSLSRANLTCGIAEALKMGLICDSELYYALETHSASLIASGFQTPENAAIQILLRAETAMMGQLGPNLFEADLARLVDFGHTFSPVIEVVSEHAVPHGFAVALDMVLSTAIAAEHGLCDPGLLARLIRFYETIGLPVDHPLMSLHNLERALFEARAHRGGQLNLVVPTAIGSATFVQDVARREFAAALRRIATAVPAAREIA